MILIIDDDRIMAECIARMVKNTNKNAKTKIFSNGI